MTLTLTLTLAQALALAPAPPAALALALTLTHLEVHVPELGDVGADDLVRVQEDDLLQAQREQDVQEQDLVRPDQALLLCLRAEETMVARFKANATTGCVRMRLRARHLVRPSEVPQ